LLVACSKIKIKDGYHMTYRFDSQKLFIGLNRLKVEIFDKKENKITNFRVRAIVLMPNGTEQNPVIVRNKGSSYILPLNLYLSGKYKIWLEILKGDEIFYKKELKVEVK
jgi:hypothetical protein